MKTTLIDEEEQLGGRPRPAYNFRPLGLGGGSTASALLVPPLYSSSEIGNVDASTVAVTFDQNITASNYTTGVTIKVNTVPQTITSGTRQTDHAVVYYVLNTPAVAGDTVTWEYTGGNIAAEDDGVPLETVTAQSVTNNIISEDVMLSATVTLTDTQIKALPTTPVTIIAAPGAGKTFYVFGTFLHMNWVADYTNIDAAAFLRITNGHVYGMIENSVAGDLSLFFAGGGPDGINAEIPATGRVPALAGAATLNGYGGDYDSDIGNNPLNISVSNGASGDFTGGNAGNSLKVTVYYVVVDF